jgi:hypothetical protein
VSTSYDPTVIEESDVFLILIRERERLNWQAIAPLLGMATVLDRKILLVCPPGLPVPDKVARVVDRFIEYVSDREKLDIAIAVALHQMGLSNQCGCDNCKRVRAAAEESERE